MAQHVPVKRLRRVYGALKGLARLKRLRANIPFCVRK